MPLPTEADIKWPAIDQPYLTDAGLFQWTVAKNIRKPDETITTIFWRGGEEVTWLPVQPDGHAPITNLHRVYHNPAMAERAFLHVWPEYNQ